MKRLVRVLLLICLCLGCFNISCAQNPHDGKQGIIDKAGKLKKALENLKKLNEDYNADYNASTDKPNTENEAEKAKLKANHKKEAKDLLEKEIKPAYQSLNTAFAGDKSFTANESLQDAMTAVTTNVSHLTEQINADNITKGIQEFVPVILPALSTIEKGPQAVTSQTNVNGNNNRNDNNQPNKNTGVDNNDSDKDKDSSSVFQFLWPIMAIFIPVLISACLIFMYKREADKQFDNLTRQFSIMQRSMDTNQLNMETRLLSINQNLKSLDSFQGYDPSTFQADVKSLQAKFDALEKNSKTANSPPYPFIPELPVGNSSSQEGRVTDLISRFAKNSQKAKPAFMPNDALEQADSDAIYMLFPNEKHRELFNAIPIYPRFSSTQDFSHYSKFYDCDQPSSGEVWIVALAQATYDEQSHQWRLYKKGKLQIK